MPTKTDAPGPEAASPPPPGSISFRYPVRRVGERARGVLARPGRGEVIAVFRRSFYLRAKEGIACIGPASIQPGPLNAVCALPEDLDWEACGLRPGARSAHGEGRFVVDGRFDFLWENSQTWRPAPPAPGWAREEMAAGLSRVAGEAARRAPREGLGRLIPEMAPGRPEDRFAAREEDPFWRLARPGVSALEGWLRAAVSGSVAAPPDAAAVLIGLGPGLTPSGDDYIGGALIALRALGRDSVARRLAGWARAIAQDGTGEISRAHLACAAEGAGAEAVHGMIEAICRPSAEDFSRRLDAIDAIGHSSGWDALAGAAAVCSILLDS